MRNLSSFLLSSFFLLFPLKDLKAAVNLTGPDPHPRSTGPLFSVISSVWGPLKWAGVQGRVPLLGGLPLDHLWERGQRLSS